MSRKGRRKDARVIGRIKVFHEQFSNYENAVTFICSLETWFEHRWGDEGTEGPRELVEFDRFPKLDVLTPDFLVRFARPYLLIGEHIKTFRRGVEARKDVEQITAYSRWEPCDGSEKVPHDVVVFVDVFSDDEAAEQMEAAWAKPEEARPKAPVVILGYSRDTERVNGDWYKCKWRKHAGNRQFSTPNICSDAARGDLNAVFAGRKHHAIPVDKQALDVTKRNPLVNDPPPPLYTLVRLLYPALFDLMDDAERDQLQSDRRLEKTVTRDQILAAPILAGTTIRPGVIQDALDFLIFPMRLAKRDRSQPPRYAVTIDFKLFSKRDWKDLFSDRAARALVRKLKAAGLRRAKAIDDSKQLKLFQ